MTESDFLKEFFIISNIYRSMSNILKNKLKKCNIPLNETQIQMLFLLYNSKELSSNDMLSIGNYALSTLVFNMNNLQNFSCIEGEEMPSSNNLNQTFKISTDGKKLFEKINNLLEESYKTHPNSYKTLLAYEKLIEKQTKNI